MHYYVLINYPVPMSRHVVISYQDHVWCSYTHGMNALLLLLKEYISIASLTLNVAVFCVVRVVKLSLKATSPLICLR